MCNIFLFIESYLMPEEITVKLSLDNIYSYFYEIGISSSATKKTYMALTVSLRPQVSANPWRLESVFGAKPLV